MKKTVLALLLLCALPAAPALAQTQAAASAPSAADFARFAGDLLARRYPADGPGGAVLVARGDKILFRGARGMADVAGKVPLRPDSVFQIASVTKQFTAAGILKLVEAGKVRLDDPLTRWVPAYPGGDRITVLQLLNHTSGVKEYTELTPNAQDLAGRTTAQMIERFKDEKPDFPPGMGWKYSNSGYVLLGAIIEAATGRPWHAWLEKALFRPLGMRNTGWALDPKLAARQVRGHSWNGDKVVAPAPVHMTYVHAAGALLSNVDDLLKWNRALHEGRVLKNASYAQMVTPVGKAAGAGYGFGLRTGQVRNAAMLRHGGAIFGFASSLEYLPGPDVTVVVLENDDRNDESVGGEKPETFARRLAAMATGNPYPAMRPVPVQPAALEAAQGVYRFPQVGTRILKVVGGRLTSQRGSRGGRQPLTPIGPDDFLYPDGFERLTLVRDAEGRVTGARFYPGGDGAGDAGVRSEQGPAGAGLRLAREAAERLTGSYAGGRFVLTVTLEGEQLLAKLGGQEPVTLLAKSATEFEVEETGATIVFPDGAGKAAEAKIRQGAREIVLKRQP